MKVAMDVEGVLADICMSWIIHYGYLFTKSEITDWEFKNVGITIGRFLEETIVVWKQGKVVPEEFNLPDKMPRLPFDIVTARKGVDLEIVNWLENYRINYDNFVVSRSSTSKPLLCYDVYIDDNPYMYKNLQKGQTQILYDQPWNQDCERHKVDHPQVIRVMNLYEAKNLVEKMFNGR